MNNASALPLTLPSPRKVADDRSRAVSQKFPNEGCPDVARCLLRPVPLVSWRRLSRVGGSLPALALRLSSIYVSVLHRCSEPLEAGAFSVVFVGDPFFAFGSDAFQYVQGAFET